MPLPIFLSTHFITNRNTQLLSAHFDCLHKLYILLICFFFVSFICSTKSPPTDNVSTNKCNTTVIFASLSIIIVINPSHHMAVLFCCLSVFINRHWPGIHGPIINNGLSIFIRIILVIPHLCANSVLLSLFELDRRSSSSHRRRLLVILFNGVPTTNHLMDCFRIQTNSNQKKTKNQTNTANPLKTPPTNQTL